LTGALQALGQKALRQGLASAGGAEIAKSCHDEKSILPPAGIRMTLFTGQAGK